MIGVRPIIGLGCGLGFVVAIAIAMAQARGEGPEPARANVPEATRAEVLESIGGLPAHIVGRFRDPIRFVQLASGAYLVLDRRAHTVTRIDRSMETVEQVVEIGFEEGRVLVPSALAVAPNGDFAVADAPNLFERIQFFTSTGLPLGAFFLTTRVAPRLAVGALVLNGVGSLQFTGQSFLVNRPQSDALITELDLQGHPIRHVGTLRPTGHEGDQALHLALNTGLPLIDPTGGTYFVFQGGRPMFRKYDASGNLVFERHIEGPELDADIQTLPTTWPERSTAVGTFPVVAPLVRTAAVDDQGQLWVSLVSGTTYVYDARGEKVRTVQFRGAGALAPTSLFFTTDGRVLVTPGCFAFAAGPVSRAGQTP